MPSSSQPELKNGSTVQLTGRGKKNGHTSPRQTSPWRHLSRAHQMHDTRAQGAVGNSPGRLEHSGLSRDKLESERGGKPPRTEGCIGSASPPGKCTRP